MQSDVSLLGLWGPLQAKSREGKNLGGRSSVDGIFGQWDGIAKGSEFTQTSFREGQEGSEQGSPESEGSGGHAGKPDRQRETTPLLV